MHNKKRLYISVISAACIIVVVALIWVRNSRQNNNSGMSLPEISAITYDGKLFELDKQDKVKTTIVFFFSPECDHCEEEIKGILSRESLLENKDIRWIFITMDVLKDELGVFLESYPIDKASNAFVLLDSALYYHNLFEVTGSPTVFMFDKSGAQVHKIVGGFNINILTQWL